MAIAIYQWPLHFKSASYTPENNTYIKGWAVYLNKVLSEFQFWSQNRFPGEEWHTETKLVTIQ